jgi:hypothetical protein
MQVAALARCWADRLGLTAVDQVYDPQTKRRHTQCTNVVFNEPNPRQGGIGLLRVCWLTKLVGPPGSASWASNASIAAAYPPTLPSRLPCPARLQVW